MKIRSLLLFCVAALFLVAAIGLAQTISGDLTGTIYDPSGASVPNASIVVRNDATGVETQTRSGNTGEYRISNLPVGTYTITVTAAGFSKADIKGVAVELSKTSTRNVRLEVGQSVETVEVADAAATIDTTTAQLQNSYQGSQIVALPIIENANGLYGALNLSLLSAGVASNGGVGQGIGPSVGGQRPVSNNYMIEGVDNNNKGVTGPLAYVPQEATAEFTLMENQAGSEFGHSTGGQFNTIVRSGGNNVHGSAYEYFQNRNLNALDQSFARQGFTSPTRYDQNKLGFSVGGPIKKDKLFYFGNFEYAPFGFASTTTSPVLAPTAQGYSTLASIPGISTTNLNIMKQYVPAAPVGSGDTDTVAGKTIPLGILPIAGANFTNFYTYLASVDYNASEKDQLRGRFIYNKSNGLDNYAVLPEFWTTLPQRFYIVTLSEFHTFSPNLTNEFRLGFNRFSQYYVTGSQTFPGLDVFPNLTLDTLNGLQIGPDPNAPQFTVQNTYQLTENINWTRGNHSFKFGYDGRDSISPQFFIQRVRGDYDYADLNEYLTDQIPTGLAERNLGNTPYYGNGFSNYLYANDQWRIRHNFTINLGIRWERNGVAETMNLQKLNALSNAPGVLLFNAPHTYNKAFAPRLGLAYSPGTSGKTSIRAGFGMSYDIIYDNVGLTAYPPQLSPTVDACNSPGNCPGYSAPFLAKGGILPNTPLPGSGGNADPVAARQATSAYIPDQLPPYSIQWNLGVQHVFHNDYTLEVRYLGTRGIHMLVQEQINKSNTPVTASRTLPTYLQAPNQATLNSLSLTLPQLQAISPYNPVMAAAGFNGASITAFMPTGVSTYNGLAVQLNRRFSHGMMMQGAYTWSHNIDNSTASHFTTVLTPRRPMDFSNLSNDKSSSALDRRQRLTVSWMWDAPWFSHGKNWMAKNIIGNWRLTGTYTAETGELGTVQSIQDSNLNGDSWPDRALLNPAGDPKIGSGVTALTNSSGATVAYLAKNPNAGYIQAGKGVFATAGRNTIQFPGINNWDMSLAKNFNFGETKKISIRADAANLFNHSQFTPGLISSVKLTQYNSGDRSFLGPQSSNFQAWSDTFPSNSRTMQLALRVEF